jgi:hypothetical protein
MGRGSSTGATTLQARRAHQVALDVVTDTRSLIWGSRRYSSSGPTLQGPLALLDVIAHTRKPSDEDKNMITMIKASAPVVSSAAFTFAQAVYEASGEEMPIYPDQPQPTEWEMIPDLADTDEETYERAFDAISDKEKIRMSAEATLAYIAKARESVEEIDSGLPIKKRNQNYLSMKKIFLSTLDLFELSVSHFAS